MGQIKNIKLHIVTDIKKKSRNNNTMSSATCEALMIESGAQESIDVPAEDPSCAAAAEEIAEEPVAEAAEETVVEEAAEELAVDEPAVEEPVAEEPVEEEEEEEEAEEAGGDDEEEAEAE